ncbi:MAG: exopolysaccharide biosynthesis protein [Pseudomonadota bacterium]
MTDAAPKPRTLLQAFEAMADEAGEDGFALKEIFDRLDERAFGAGLFILALPCCIPFLYLVPQIVAVPMAALAAQMALGREEPWLPGALGERRIDKKGLTNTARGGRKWFGWVEAIARPRLTWLTGPKSEQALGMLLFVFCLSIMLPFPLTNTIPGFAVAGVAFGLMARDGLLVMLSSLVGAAWVGALVAAFVFGVGFLAGRVAESGVAS